MALNEAEWHNAEVRTGCADALVDLRVLALSEERGEPDDEARVVRLHLGSVGRVAASLRLGRHDDERAAVQRFALDDLNEVVGGFGGQPIFGWQFFDPPDEAWDHWRHRLSLDVTISNGSQTHVLQLFQEAEIGRRAHLDLRIWFDRLTGYDGHNRPRDLVSVAQDGRRWWEAMLANDPRIRGYGIVRSGRLEGPDWEGIEAGG